MSWNPFKKKKSVANEPVQIRIVDSNRMTVAEWRRIPGLVIAAQKVLAEPHVKAMLEVLRHDAPHNYGTIVKGAQPTEFIHRVGDIEGYLKCLNNLEALAVPLETHEMPEATFEEEEKE